MTAFFYLYGLIPTAEKNEKSFIPFKGIDKEHESYTISMGDITAIGSDVREEEYSEEVIKDKMNNDMEWLQEKAMHHHDVLAALQNKYTVIPMKFCTIYKSKSSMEQQIGASRKKINDSFLKVMGNEEWNLKIYYDGTKLKEHLRNSHPGIAAKKEEIRKLPPGRQFFEKRKLDQHLDQEVEREINKRCEDIHNQLTQFSDYSTVKKNLSKEVTGKIYDMSWNSVYLIPLPQVEAFLEDIQEKKQSYEEFGLQMEASGPWPAYHFANLA